MTDKITSRQNPLVKEWKAMRDDRSAASILLEGPHLVEEALKMSCSLEALIWTPAMQNAPILEAAKAKAARLVEVSDAVFDAISDVGSPQGIAAVTQKPVWDWSALVEKLPRLILVLDGLQDPGNVASIVRTAEAGGAAGIVTTRETARIFSPKVLRGAAGASLRLPSLEHVSEGDIAAKLKDAGCRLFAATMAVKGQASKLYTDVDWKKPIALVLGQEGRGVSRERWGVFLDEYTYVPMVDKAESLNAAAAAAVFVYEAHRQCA